MIFEVCKSVYNYDIPVLRCKLTCRLNSIKILVRSGRNVLIRWFLNITLIFLLKLCNTSFKRVGFFLGYIDTTVGLMG